MESWESNKLKKKKRKWNWTVWNSKKKKKKVVAYMSREVTPQNGIDKINVNLLIMIDNKLIIIVQ